MACALGGSLSKTAEVIESIAKEAGWTAYLPHRDTAAPGDSSPASEVLMKNLAAVFTSDCLVAETAPSLGVGIELMWARMAGKRVILLNREGRSVSRMVAGLLPEADVITYRSLDDAKEKVCEKLRAVAEQCDARRHAGLLVVLEGRDGVGKSEAADRVVKLLDGAGLRAIRSNDPPHVSPWKELKELFERGEKVDRLAEAVTLLAGRVDNTRRVIEPELAKGTIVISDRYFLSWFAYQDYRLKDRLESEEQRRHWLVFTHALASVEQSILQPDLTLFLDASDSVRRDRRKSRGDPPSKYDAEEVQAAVEKSYRALSGFDRYETHHIDTSSLTPDAVASIVFAKIGELRKSGPTR